MFYFFPPLAVTLNRLRINCLRLNKQEIILRPRHFVLQSCFTLLLVRIKDSETTFRSIKMSVQVCEGKKPLLPQCLFSVASVLINDPCAWDGDVSDLLRSMGHCFRSLFGLLRSWKIPTFKFLLLLGYANTCPGHLSKLTMPQCKTLSDFWIFSHSVGSTVKNGLLHSSDVPLFMYPQEETERNILPLLIWVCHTNSSSWHQEGIFCMGALVLQKDQLTGNEVKWELWDTLVPLMQGLPRFICRVLGHLTELRGGEQLCSLHDEKNPRTGDVFLPSSWFFPHNFLWKCQLISYFEQELRLSCR